MVPAITTTPVTAEFCARLLAARPAASGWTGMADPVGPDGVLGVLAPAVDTTKLGGYGELEQNAFKPHPCGIDAAPGTAPRVDPSVITAVSITRHPPELMGRRGPVDGLQARFSAYHVAAAGRLDGVVGLPQFTSERAQAPDARARWDLITPEPDERCTRDEAARVAQRAAELVTVHIEPARGSPARPLTDVELVVDGLTEPVLGAGSARDPRCGRRAGRRARRAHDPPSRGEAHMPTTGWVLQVAREARPEDQAARELLRRFESAGDAGTAPDLPAGKDPQRTAAAKGAPGLPRIAVCAAATAPGGGDRAVAAVSLGCQVAERVTVEFGLPHPEPGWDVRATAGVIGAGTVAGWRCALDDEQLGLCATQASGLTASAGTDAEARQQGKAVTDAVEAASLGQCGFTSSAEPLDGRCGMFALTAPDRS
ncbi:MmgE/PrpD family protein [Amycolatopsis sp. NPDC051903]|uniref:MmgE/PrpD family protein n=1 Tax=Amycolatopsis sp. NPDC051903 TaxID=3363936 RepID=UPI0037B928C2